MKILGNETWIKIDRRGGVESGDIKRVMIHYVVEINANAEAMGDFDHAQQLRFGAVTRANGAALILASLNQIDPKDRADGEAATAFSRRRQPTVNRIRFGQLRNFHGQRVPIGVEYCNIASPRSGAAVEAGKSPPRI